MKILVTGGTGFVGRPLVKKLAEANHQIVLLTRNPEAAKKSISAPMEVYGWEPETSTPPKEAYNGIDAIVHLAGESIAAGRWTAKQKKKILDSRVLSTRNLLKGAVEAGAKPKVIVSASAIGIYGDRGNQSLSETSAQGIGFLADVCRAWERETQYPGLESVRKVNLRIGIVLEKGGGALQKLLPLFKIGGGGPVGNGKQWMSWIHLSDLVEMIMYSLTHDTVSGATNAVAPNPSTNAEFSRALGKALHRPAFMPAPPFALKLAMGEMSELVLASQKVEAKKIESAGFVFKFPKIQEALDDICKKV
ncbi:MAG: TIGR01777 family protein [Proteobacteria bacterium]|nr:TIGR01777 family protein [Pseudomonadota bacterium]NBY21012.1 TIGR01777 family protein [bacterium]